MYKRALTKPDGRRLILYSRRPIADPPFVPAPSPDAFRPNAHLRWHPLRGEWIVCAAGRQQRTFLPSDHNPLGPTIDPARPTELPDGDYDAAVFENRFPSLTPLAHDPPSLAVDTRPAHGVCEMVVFARDPGASLGSLPLLHLELMVAVWADRYRELGARDDVRYVFPFENRGAEVGATLQHPHGQIYAYPFVPPIPARELANQLAYYERHGRGLLESIVADEIAAARRLVYAGPEVVAFVPVCARYAFEMWIAPRRAAPSLAALDAPAARDLARALKTVLLKLDGLWREPMPYVLVFHQAPTDGALHPEAHVHVEIYPAYRMRGRQKYLAGSEIGAGVFTADTDPDLTAAELQAVQVAIDA